MDRWTALFGSEDDWERERPAMGWPDWSFALAWWLVLAVSMELIRSFADMRGASPWWQEHLLILLSCVPLAFRRRWPLLAVLLGFATFFATLTLAPEVGTQVFYQLTFFTLLFSFTSWTRDRQHVALAVAGIGVLLFLWVGWDLATGAGIDSIMSRGGYQPHGLLPPAVAYAGFSVIANVIYLLGSVVLGQMAWVQARDRARLAESVALVRTQSQALRKQAVVEERLRIARELHDVVAHHVSVMGIQAGAARRLLEAKPDQAAQALANVETSAREAVTQMRGLLGALRAADPAAAPEDEASRGPQPTLRELPSLVTSMRPTMHATLDVVERPGAAQPLSDRLPLPLQLSLYRTVQEALANVVKHSTARTASVVVREGDGYVEAEILDEGHPKGTTGGTGLGLVGLRERVASHGGTTEIGPRVTGGYRVRVRFPLGVS